MTSTDELRALLDERGAEYHINFDGSTEWNSSAGDYSGGVDCGDGKLIFTGCLTPAQAIEATLGRGTCKMVVDNHHRVDKVTTSWGCVCSACGGFHQYTHGDGWAFCPSCGRKVER